MGAGYLNLSVRAVIFFTECSNHVHFFPLSAPISQSKMAAQKKKEILVPLLHPILA